MTSTTVCTFCIECTCVRVCVRVCVRACVRACVQPSVRLCVINPEPCSGHFQLSIPFYNGDSAGKVAMRIRRIDKSLKGNRSR